MADTIVRLFDHPADAVRAIDRLEGMGVKPDHISLVANNREEWYGEEGIRHDKLHHHHHRIKDDNLNGKDDRAEGAAGGATTGGLIGGGVGLLAVPGLGPVVAAGWLASTAAGAAVGAVGGGVLGGIVGALTHEGVDKRDAAWQTWANCPPFFCDNAPRPDSRDPLRERLSRACPTCRLSGHFGLSRYSPRS